MPYSLVWTIQARDKCTALWLDLWASDPVAAGRFTVAVNWIDQQLKSAPQSGQRRNADLVMCRDQVEIVYNYSQLNHLVTVIDIDLIAPNIVTAKPIP